jgi:hypothetical protein
MVPEGSQGVDRVVREVWKPCPCRLAPQDGPWSRWGPWMAYSGWPSSRPALLISFSDD